MLKIQDVFVDEGQNDYLDELSSQDIYLDEIRDKNDYLDDLRSHAAYQNVDLDEVGSGDLLRRDKGSGYLLDELRDQDFY